MNIRDQRFINKIHNNQYKVIWEAAATEIDNHDDTHCFGANFRLILFTSEDWPLYPFLPEHKKELNVPICTGFTDLTLDYRELLIW